MLTKTGPVLICLSVTAHVYAMQTIPPEYLVQARAFIAEHRSDIDCCRPLFISEVEANYHNACTCIVHGCEKRLLENVFEWAHCTPVSFTYSSWSFFKMLTPDALIHAITTLSHLRILVGTAMLAPNLSFIFGDNYMVEFMGPEVEIKPAAERIKNFSAALLAQLTEPISSK